MSKPTDSGSSKSGRCDREALAAFAGGTLDQQAQQVVVDHLEHCEACRRTLGWLAGVDSMLGLPVEGHPPAADIVRAIDGELSAAERQALREHLDGCAECRQLEAAARAALGEADQIEQSLRWHENRASDQTSSVAGSEGEDQRASRHLLVRIPLLHQPRAAAADDSTVEAPVPQDRQVLLEEKGLFRLVYYRLAARGRAGLFAGADQRLQVLECALDGEVLSPAEIDGEGLVYDLGPVSELPGRTLAVRLRAGKTERSVSWTFVGA